MVRPHTVLSLSALLLVLLPSCSRKEESRAADFERNPATRSASATAAGTGVQFASLSYEKALEKARSEGKIVMIDFYADWCGWCKKMDKEVFSDPRMTAATANIVPIRLDAENEGEAHAQRLGVSGLPTVIFVDGQGKVLERLVGYTRTDRMLQVLESLSKQRA